MVVGQVGSPTPGVGVEEALDFWPVAIRGAWFLCGFLLVLALGWFVVEPLVSRAVRHRNRNNATIQAAITQYLRLLIALAGLLFGTVLAGYGGFLAESALVVAAVTLALGVAAQTVIGSFVSGLVLVVDPEFSVGDYIHWGDDEGTVQSITLRVTRVLTPAGELITVPNTVLTEQEITRPYGRGRYRVVDRIDLAFEADVERAIPAIEAAIEDVDGIAEAPSPRVYVESFGADTVTIATHYWIAEPSTEDVLVVRSAFARAVRDRLTAAEIEMSPPSTRELEGRIQVENAE